jgi:hypothetical protein
VVSEVRHEPNNCCAAIPDVGRTGIQPRSVLPLR